MKLRIYFLSFLLHFPSVAKKMQKLSTSSWNELDWWTHYESGEIKWSENQIEIILKTSVNSKPGLPTFIGQIVGLFETTLEFFVPVCCSPLFFNLFWFTSTFRSLKRFGGTLTWLKMTICGIIGSKTSIKRQKFKIWRHLSHLYAVVCRHTL